MLFIFERFKSTVSKKTAFISGLMSSCMVSLFFESNRIQPSNTRGFENFLITYTILKRIKPVRITIFYHEKLTTLGFKPKMKTRATQRHI